MHCLVHPFFEGYTLLLSTFVTFNKLKSQNAFLTHFYVKFSRILQLSFRNSKFDGKLFIASSFSLSMALVYFSTCLSPLCPNRLEVVLMLAPLLRIFTAKE